MKNDFYKPKGTYARTAAATRVLQQQVGGNQQQLAEKLGISATTVSHLVNGKMVWSPKLALRAEATLQVSAVLLMNLSGEDELDLERQHPSPKAQLKVQSVGG